MPCELLKRFHRLPLKIRGVTLGALLLFNVLVGCHSGLSKTQIRGQLEQHEVFSKPEVWYIYLGTQTTESMSHWTRLDTKARDLGLTTNSYFEAQPVILKDGSVQWIDEKIVPSVLENGGLLAVRMLDPKGILRWVPQVRVEEAKRHGGRIADRYNTPTLNSDKPISIIALTDKGKQFLQEPGSILTDNETGFVIAHRTVLEITKINRLGPDSMVVDFEWRSVPSDVGKLFEPTLGISAQTAKALFRIDEHKGWSLMDPHSWESNDPRTKEFDLHDQISSR